MNHKKFTYLYLKLMLYHTNQKIKLFIYYFQAKYYPNNSHFFSKLPFSQINSDLKMFFLQSLYFLHQKTTFHWGRSSRNNKYFFAKFDKIENFDLHKFQHSNGLAFQSI